MNEPYGSSGAAWLQRTEEQFFDMLESAGHLTQTLKVLEKTFTLKGEHILDFLAISQEELETAYRVCEKIMDGLGPSARAMRKEIEERAQRQRPGSAL